MVVQTRFCCIVVMHIIKVFRTEIFFPISRLSVLCDTNLSQVINLSWAVDKINIIFIAYNPIQNKLNITEPYDSNAWCSRSYVHYAKLLLLFYSLRL